MIKISKDFDLGQDKTRIKDPRDGERQRATVEALLSRFFHSSPSTRSEVQILADEVGMGKTFVALGVAYSILQHLRGGKDEPDLRGCYQKVLIVSPQNSALFSKWTREVSEFVKRCVRPPLQAEASAWFMPASIDRLDDLIAELRRPGIGRRVIVTNTGIFARGKLLNYDVKRRLLLGTLFRFWGNRFRIDARERLLKGAPNFWPRDPGSLTTLTDDEHEIVSFSEDELLRALEDITRPSQDESATVDTLLQTCLEIAAPYTRSRDERFGDIDKQLTTLYRALVVRLIRSDLPLVIVDEAHNWKNGPCAGANGYRSFAKIIACRSRRVLLLTATPFQLRPDEMLEILKVSDELAPCQNPTASDERRALLARHRERVVRPVLQNSAQASRRFARAWSRLPREVTTELLETAWTGAGLANARAALSELAERPGLIDAAEADRLARAATASLDPALREMMREGLLLYVYNAELSGELGRLVIRHRRRTLHRAFLVGRDYPGGVRLAAARPDRHVLHASPGIDVMGEGELPHYLLMRCVSEMKGGRGRSSLGSALTGCYSTLLHSAEGRDVQKRLKDSPVGGVYLGLLSSLVDKRQDERHPKLAHVVESVINAWHVGEKSLIFCFRVNTAERLRNIIDARIRRELAQRRKRCLGGEEALLALRRRLTGRERDLVGLGLDRVLWSWYWAVCHKDQLAVEPSDLLISAIDFTAIATVALQFGIDLTGERLDRIFIHRVIEHVVAGRNLRTGRVIGGDARALLKQVAALSWVSHPYGLVADDIDDAASSTEERPDFDERGVHTVYDLVDETPAPLEVEKLATRLVERWERARSQNQLGVFDAYERGPNLWLGAEPAAVTTPTRQTATVRELHSHLRDLSVKDGKFDWESRRLVMQALRRAVLRESVLLRLLPEKTDLAEGRWGDLLAEQFFKPMPGQSETMADRIAVFLEDLGAASGDVAQPGTARHDFFEATRLKDQQFVALVSGAKDDRTKARIFAGFNTPLLPEILVCTSVGQEGIDLHRHCRHVVHYDLAWNPAVLEQRTGRADRIGSKTFRERDRMETTAAGPFLEIGVPFLAGTYDERMYEELRLRAQTFEILTGGDLAAENPDGGDETPDAEGKSIRVPLEPLPDAMVAGLRVHLHVWSEPPGTTGKLAIVTEA